jgi:GNAT superfamily N-acetyltransferase
MISDIFIKHADSSEVPILLNKWIEKCNWLNEKGLFTWNITSFTEENLATQYQNPQYYVCYLQDELVGGFILITQDNFFWPEMNDNYSLYIHKIMVCNGHNGKGFGNQILNWIKQFGLSNNKKYLRLDFFKNKNGLKQFYEENGFYTVEEVKFKDRDLIVKAEYKLA